MNTAIREATPDDSEKILAYLDELSREGDIDILLTPGELNLTVEEERKIVAEFAAAPNSVFLLATSDDNIIGMLTCKGQNRERIKHCTSMGMSVHKQWRDKKIGHALMDAMIDWAKKSSVIKRIELSAYTRNKRAIHLYEKYGFQVEGSRRKFVFDHGEYLDDTMMALLV